MATAKACARCARVRGWVSPTFYWDEAVAMLVLFVGFLVASGRFSGNRALTTSCMLDVQNCD